MSDEEKKAIEFFEKSFKKKIPPYWYDDTISNIEEKIKTLLNLIEKQQKEIEELKADKYGLEEEVQIQAKQLIEIDGNYISKEESEQKERKAYIKGTNDADKLCNKKWEDKIKAKVEEVHYKMIGHQDLREAVKEALESLSEKEI